MAIELKQASPQEVSIYIPYYKESNKRTALPYAISLYKQAELAGERHIEGSSPISFVAVWRVANLPSDITLCRVTFAGDDDMSYEMTLENSEFMGYLIEVVASIRDKNSIDVPQVLFSKLFRLKLSCGEL